MEKSISYIKNLSVVLLSGLSLFVMVGVIMVILNAITWEILGDWSSKALLVAGVLLVGNLVVSLLLGAVSRDK